MNLDGVEEKGEETSRAALDAIFQVFEADPICFFPLFPLFLFRFVLRLWLQVA